MLRILFFFTLALVATVHAGCGDDVGSKPGTYCTFNDATQDFDIETTCPIGSYCMGGNTKRLPCPPSVMDQCTVEGLSALPDLNAAL